MGEKPWQKSQVVTKMSDSVLYPYFSSVDCRSPLQFQLFSLPSDESIYSQSLLPGTINSLPQTKSITVNMRPSFTFCQSAAFHWYFIIPELNVFLLFHTPLSATHLTLEGWRKEVSESKEKTSLHELHHLLAAVPLFVSVDGSSFQARFNTVRLMALKGHISKS